MHARVPVTIPAGRLFAAAENPMVIVSLSPSLVSTTSSLDWPLIAIQGTSDVIEITASVGRVLVST